MTEDVDPYGGLWEAIAEDKKDPSTPPDGSAQDTSEGEAQGAVDLIHRKRSPYPVRGEGRVRDGLT